MNISLRSEFMLLTNSMNNKGELGSPCLRPIYESKNCEKDELYLIHNLTVKYMDLYALTNLQLTLSTNNFCQFYRNIFHNL